MNKVKGRFSVAHMASSRRRLSFPPVSEETESSTCTLCLGKSTNMSTPRTWKSIPAQKVASTLHLEQHSPVCRLRRSDITMLVKNPEYQPRWEKRTEAIKCCVPECRNAAFVQSKIASTDQIASILGYMNAPCPTPLCKHHYHVVYNAIQPRQTHCCTCGSSLRTGPTRPCPDPERIQHLLSEKTGFAESIPKGANVCISCYKSQLQMLKEVHVPVSTDSDLMALMHTLRNALRPIEEVKDTEGNINRALHKTIIYVGERLLHQEALLLPSVHESFCGFAQESLLAANLELDENVESLVTARWVLSNLTTKLLHHLT